MIRSLLTLIRWPHLLMIAFVQYTMRYTIVEPIVLVYGCELQLSALSFFSLVLATVCTAAAGFAINDYFDIRADAVNRPQRQVVGRQISRRQAMMTHIVFCVAGIVLGGYATWRAGVPRLAMFFVIVAGILWLYSFTYKRQFLVGNLFVALFTAFIPLMTLLDLPLINRTYRDYLLEHHTNFNLLIFWLCGFAVFCFLTALSREIIRDTEEFEGDRAYGFRSIVIVLGTNAAKWSVVAVNLITIALLGWVFFSFLNTDMQGHFDFPTFLYFALLIVVPLLWVSVRMLKAETGDDYHRLDYWMRFVILAGISYGFIVCYKLS